MRNYILVAGLALSGLFAGPAFAQPCPRVGYIQSSCVPFGNTEQCDKYCCTSGNFIDTCLKKAAPGFQCPLPCPTGTKIKKQSKSGQ
jgi:hypothetical protein